MATLLLQAAGAAIGGLAGATGAAIGTAMGAVAGYMIDRALIGSTKHVHGPRLSGPRPLSAEEGQPIPRLYGTARLGATLIWATRFEEAARTERQGGKGGPKVTRYSYFANLALALCEGEIAGVRRIWADGQEIDRAQVEFRLYRGTGDQLPDPLIEAKQGEGNAPAYRGIAYAVFERYPLEIHGNRIPQFQFEIIRPVGRLHQDIRAIALVPGASEYGLCPGPVTRVRQQYWGIGKNLAGGRETLNRALPIGASDFTTSLDELQELCPALENAALVVTWFGDDLSAARCRVEPRIAHGEAPDGSQGWQVSGLSRAAANEVTRHDGNPAYGGTPSDRSVMEAIAELRDRGLKVTLYPFLMMDIAAGNGLGDPYGGPSQPAYPWRGRITCDPAPGLAETADGTTLAEAQVAAFCGEAQPVQFSAAEETVHFSGNAGEWSYRRMILHHAHLARAAGGVDAFLIGSELRGLTSIRDSAGEYPFVRQLMQLAEEVKEILGSETQVTYGADWSEYFGHHPQDGSGDVRFHLDPLWASPAIDAVGIDNYFPLSDWRDGDHGGGNPDGACGPCDVPALAAAIAGGEGFDWYYASEEDRTARLRTPIRDTAHGKDWVFRCKDLRGWWENLHHERIGGVEQAEPTVWLPCMKPIWFTELGCAAIDKGPNQPNLFGDPKSSESGRPWFSHGGRDDQAQRAFLAAHFQTWDPQAAEAEVKNPVSPAYGGHMVDPARIHVWCWDTRPFPAFPCDRGRWSDGGNWSCGHWLNGRLGSAAAGDIIQAILADHGLPPADVRLVSGTLSGLVVDRPEPARATLEILADLLGMAVRETDDGFCFFDEATPPLAPLAISDWIVAEEGEALSTMRVPAQELPGEIAFTFRDPLQDYQTVTVRHDMGVEEGGGLAEISLPVICEASRGRALAAGWLRRQWTGRDRIRLRLPASMREIRPGSVIELPHAGASAPFMVTGIEDGLARLIEAKRVLLAPPEAERPDLPTVPVKKEQLSGPPLVAFPDLPWRDGGDAASQFRVAAWSAPWRTFVVSASPEDTGYSQRVVLAAPAVMGILRSPLAPGPAGRLDFANVLELQLLSGELYSVSLPQLMNGANLLTVQCANQGWEVLQFAGAEEILPSVWQLSGLLRAQSGTEDAMQAGAPAGSLAILLDSAVIPAGILPAEAGLELRWRVQPAGLPSDPETMAEWTGSGGLRALLPLAPVHLQARKRTDGGLDLGWIRRGRIDADRWLGTEIPLGEEQEAYLVRIIDENGAVLREDMTGEAAWHYAASLLATDRAGGAALFAEVAQLSAAAGPGIFARLKLDPS